MRRLREATSKILIGLLTVLGLALAAAPGAWAQAADCKAGVELDKGSAKELRGVAHSVLDKQYPYLVAQEGDEMRILNLDAVARVQRLEEDAKGAMIGLLLFEVELNSGKLIKLGFNGSTLLVGAGPDGQEQIPFAGIKKITISCP